jgi:hypothetical protein
MPRRYRARLLAIVEPRLVDSVFVVRKPPKCADHESGQLQRAAIRWLTL